MAITGWSASDYLSRSAVVWPGSLPFLVSGWGQVASGYGGATGAGFCIGVAAGEQRRGVGVFGTQVRPFAEAFTNGTGGSANINTGDGAGTDVWFNATGAWVATNLREIWRDGAAKQTNTSSATISAPDITNLGSRAGIRPGNPAPWPANGGLAEFSVWDVAGFTLANRNVLAALLADTDAGNTPGNAPNPLAVNDQAGQPWGGALVAYYDMREIVDVGGGVFIVPDLSGNGHDLTVVGSLSIFGSHPPVDPAPGEVVSKESAVGVEALAGISQVAGTRTSAEQIFSDDFTGTNNDPWDPLKWDTDISSGSTMDIQSGEGRTRTGDVGAVGDSEDFARAVAVHAPVRNGRLEFDVRVPGGGLRDWFYVISLRGDGDWASDSQFPNFPAAGYWFQIGGHAGVTDANQMFMGRGNGTTKIDLTSRVTLSDAVTLWRVRFEVVQGAIRSIARPAASGPLPDDVWDFDIEDATFPDPGIVQIGLGGSETITPREVSVIDVVLSELQLVGGTPFEALAGVHNDRVVPFESAGVAVVSQLQLIRYESLFALGDDVAAFFEAPRSITRQVLVPLEATATGTRAVAAPLESLLGLNADSAARLESLARVSRPRGSPLEVLAVVSRETLFPLEAGHGLQRSIVVPLETESATVAVVADAIVRLEALGAVQRAAGIPSEATRTLGAVRLAPTEALRLLTRDVTVPIESTAAVVAIVADAAVLLEALAGVSRAVQAPFEVGGVFVAVARDIALPLEALRAVTLDGVVRYEAEGEPVGIVMVAGRIEIAPLMRADITVSNAME